MFLVKDRKIRMIVFTLNGCALKRYREVYLKILTRIWNFNYTSIQIELN